MITIRTTCSPTRTPIPSKERQSADNHMVVVGFDGTRGRRERTSCQETSIDVICFIESRQSGANQDCRAKAGLAPPNSNHVHENGGEGAE